MKKKIAYEVALEADGSAETTLVLSYTNTAPASFSLSSSVFRDYLRVYRAAGTVLTPGVGISVGSTMTVEDGLPVVAREFSLLRGASHTETIVTRVAGAWTAGLPIGLPRSPATASGATSASSGGGVSHYRLFIVRQADLQDVPISVTVAAPQGWRVSGVTAWRTAPGETLNTVAEEGIARLSLPLDADVVLDVVMERR
jgi:hypothetical protein